ncbi:MAG: hypothetical protein A4E56_00111 [Pelotomaculum sp. PtaU1.Bin065]|nr:MAG: hypothetical protein A4E56_00111 [Pelotomaculum sp. PtaU1.Bin065]
MLGNQSLEQYLGIGLDALGTDPIDNNIDIDKYDRRSFKELKEASSEIGNLLEVKAEDGKSLSKAWSALLRDVWSTFYKILPELTDAEKVDTPYKSMRPMIERLLEDQETAKTRITTMMDEMAAGLATIGAGKKLLEEVQKREELNQALQKADQAIDAQEQGDSSAAGTLAEEAQSLLQQAARDVTRAVREAVEEARAQANQAEQAMAGWGLESADMQNMPLGDRLNMARRMCTPNLKRLADLVGRMRNLARAKQKERVDKNRDEVHSITVGNDLGHLLPLELAALSQPARKSDFYRRYNEHQLLQYDLKTKEKVGRGPIIALIDISGSMGGNPLEWAVAVALALADTAARQKRRFMVAFFDTRVKLTMEFEPGEKSPEKLMQMATVGAAGGTDYKPALALALKTIQDVNYQKADVLMATDGLCQVDSNFLNVFLEEKKRLGFRAWTVLIGGYRPDDNMKVWSDEVWPVRALTDETAGEIFEKVY